MLGYSADSVPELLVLADEVVVPAEMHRLRGSRVKAGSPPSSLGPWVCAWSVDNRGTPVYLHAGEYADTGRLRSREVDLPFRDLAWRPNGVIRRTYPRIHQSPAGEVRDLSVLRTLALTRKVVEMNLRSVDLDALIRRVPRGYGRVPGLISLMLQGIVPDTDECADAVAGQILAKAGECESLDVLVSI
jgi:hypothetical protein